MRFFETSEKTLMDNSIGGVWSHGILSSSSCERLLGTGSLILSIAARTVPVSGSQDIAHVPRYKLLCVLYLSHFTKRPVSDEAALVNLCLHRRRRGERDGVPD